MQIKQKEKWSWGVSVGSHVYCVPLAQSWWCSLVLWVYNRTEIAEGAGSEVCTVAETTPIAVDDTNTLVTWYNKGITHMKSHREEKQTNNSNFHHWVCLYAQKNACNNQKLICFKKTMCTFLNDLLLLLSWRTLYMILKVFLLSISLSLSNIMHVNTLVGR